MSRVGKVSIEVPKEVQVSFDPKCRFVSVNGSLGELSYTYSDLLSCEYGPSLSGSEDSTSDATGSADSKDLNLITFSLREGIENSDMKSARSHWGLARSIVANMVQGVSKGFEVKLEVVGVGFKASVVGDTLFLSLGYSHPIAYAIPAGITIKCPRPTLISITGCNKQLVGRVAAKIRDLRKPEPYKGKGVKYEGEVILRKEGKKK